MRCSIPSVLGLDVADVQHVHHDTRWGRWTRPRGHRPDAALARAASNARLARRTSRSPWSSRRAYVLLVGDVLTPGDGAAVLVVLLHGDMDHEPIGGGAVPVVLFGLEEDAVAGMDLLDGAALALA